jgi:hypothetical protein
VARLVIAGAIFTGTVGWGAWRHHHLQGQWGLLSDNGPMGRLGADTTYTKVQAHWRAPDGAMLSYAFESPPRAALGQFRELDIDGYVGDPAQLERARVQEVSHMKLGERLARWLKNTTMLFVGGTLWPLKISGWRLKAYDYSQDLLLFGIYPLAALGMIARARWPTVLSVVCTAHLLTALVIGAFYGGEQRYRMPYDVFAMLLAFDVLCGTAAWVGARIRRRSEARG